MKKTFEDLLKEKGYSINRLMRESTLPISTISNLKQGKSNFEEMKIRNGLKITKALNMTIEEITDYLQEKEK